MSVKEWFWEGTTFFKWKLKNLGWFKYFYCASKSIDKYNDWQNKARCKCKKCEWPWNYAQATIRKHSQCCTLLRAPWPKKPTQKPNRPIPSPRPMEPIYAPDLKRVPLWMNFKIKKGEKTKTDISKGYKPKRITGAFKDWIQKWRW